MDKQHRDALPKLRAKIDFTVEEVTPLDHYYTDGSSVGSLFKLVFQGAAKERVRSVVYIFKAGWIVSFGAITDEESLAIHDWIDEVNSQASS